MRVWLVAVAGLGVLLGSNRVRAQALPDAKAHGWQENLEAAKALARESGKPLFLVFRCQP